MKRVSMRAGTGVLTMVGLTGCGVGQVGEAPTHSLTDVTRERPTIAEAQRRRSETTLQLASVRLRSIVALRYE